MSRNKTLVPAVVTIATVGVAAGAAYLARTRKEDMKDFMVARMLEAPAGRSSYTELGQSLERAGTFLTGRAARAADTPGNREVLGHIISIERWGQQRLQVALGQRTFQRDEARQYRPPQDASLSELRDLLSQVRSGTVDLVRQLHAAPPEEQVTVEHNGLGLLTPKAWVRYLTQHADLESRKLRGQREEGAPPALGR